MQAGAIAGRHFKKACAYDTFESIPSAIGSSVGYATALCLLGVARHLFLLETCNLNSWPSLGGGCWQNGISQVPSRASCYLLLLLLPGPPVAPLSTVEWMVGINFRQHFPVTREGGGSRPSASARPSFLPNRPAGRPFAS